MGEGERPTQPGNNGSTPVVRLEGVYKRFEALEVLRGVDLTIERRKTTVIIGESGSGKSVVLKHIVGLLKPDRGHVYFNEQQMDGLSEREWVEPRKRFGFLFQLSALFDSLTVAENIVFPLTVHTRKKRAEIADVVSQKLTMVGLDGLQDKRVSDLSGGQKKRVALARAIALDPEVILYDEPTTGLDPPRADVINELINRLREATGAAGIVVTHDMASAMKVADRIVMLHEGKFIFDGSPDAIQRTEDPRVRQFIEGRAHEEDLQALNQRGQS